MAFTDTYYKTSWNYFFAWMAAGISLLPPPPPIEKWEIYSTKRESNCNHPRLPLNSKKQICAYVHGNCTAKCTWTQTFSFC